MAMIHDFYKNANVLVTGGTGFFGKAITEKLLRTCDVSGIYILVREKRGKTVSERVEKIFSDPIFNTIKESGKQFKQKVHAIEGDLTLPKLGISSHDASLLAKKINIVFHCGASLNMEAPLQEAVTTNIKGTKNVLELCSTMLALKAAIVVSTAYSNSQKAIIEEKVEKQTISAETLLTLTEELDNNVLESIKDCLLLDRSNTYVFTKAIGETLVAEKGKTLPLGIFRPAIVLSSYSDPVPGWIDNYYGPLGIMFASGCGILKVVNVDPDKKLDMIPIDLCINALLSVAWDVHQKNLNTKNKKAEVYNFSCGDNLHLNWGDFSYTASDHYNYPLGKAIWTQSIYLTSSTILFNILAFFLHIIPALIMDGYFVITRKEPVIFKIHSKIKKVINVLKLFHSNEFVIINENTNDLWNRMSEKDKQLFPFDTSIFRNKETVKNFLINICIGVKLYLAKESMDDIEVHKKQYARYVLMNNILKFFGILLILWLFCKFFI